MPPADPTRAEQLAAAAGALRSLARSVEDVAEPADDDLDVDERRAARLARLRDRAARPPA